MNIFKVLASGRGSFQEEQASTIIAWLLNPRMEHGLGYVFLSKLVDSILQQHAALSEISSKLSPRLRSNDTGELNWSCYLEYNVQSAFIDIVLMMDNWLLAIENKIYATSTSDGQLQREYDGLKKHQDCKDKRIGMVFLVPADSDPRVEKEYSGLNVKGGDFKCIITWQPVSDNTFAIPVASISEIITSILEDESKGKIEPIPEYTRHTLKAFNQFINNNFSGYDFQPASSSGGINPLTEAIHNISKLRTLSEGYVGVKGGISGLLQMNLDKLQKHSFQYTTADMTNKGQWLTIDGNAL